MNLFRNQLATAGTRSGLWRTARLVLAGIIATVPVLGNATWEWQNPRPTPYEIWSVAFSGQDAGVLVGEGGLVMTTDDGGSTWTPRDGGVTVDGTFYRAHYVDANTIIAAGGYVALTGTSSAVVASSTDGGATWTTPTPVADLLFSDAFFTDADHGIAVGANFSTFVPTISRTSDGGVSWDTQSFDGVGYLLAVSFPDANTGYAVGYDFAASQAIALGTTDGGDTWLPQSIATDQVLNDVKFSDAMHGVAVGNAGTLFVTADGGTTWESRDAGTALDLHGIGFIGAGTIAVTGGNYVDQGIILTSTDGGDTWSSADFDRSLNYLAFADAAIGTAVGSGGEVLHTSDGGQTWTPQQESVSAQGLFGVAFVDASNGTAVGSEGTIVATKDGGESWHVQNSGTSLVLYGVAATSANDLIAVGGDITTYDHVILGTDDGGSTWTDRTPPDLLVPMLSIACPAVGVCTAVGSCGTIVHTDDAGANWTTQRATDCSSQASLESVHFRDANTGIAVGIQTILETTDGGATWTYQQPPTDQDLHAVTFIDANNGFIAGGHQQDHGTIMHTTDGGATWTIQREDIATPVQSIAFSDANDGIAVTLDATILRTHDAGATWSIDERVLANLYGVVFKDSGSAITVGFSNYNAAILGWSDHLFQSGFD